MANKPLGTNSIDFINEDNRGGEGISSLPTTRKNVADVEFATACMHCKAYLITDLGQKSISQSFIDDIRQ
jgi:hypothetical protein